MSGGLIRLDNLRGKKKQIKPGSKGTVFISVPTHREVPFRQTRESIRFASAELIEAGYRVMYQDAWGANIANNRNTGVKDAQDAKADWIMMIDDDMSFEPDAILRLIRHNLPVVSGLCVKKTWPYNTTVMFWNKEMEKYHSSLNFPVDELFECDATGTAFLLVKMSVFDKLDRPYFCFPPKNGSVLGEDLYFCQQMKAVGYRIFVDTGVHIGHLGMYPYSYKDTLLAQEIEQRKGADRVHTPDELADMSLELMQGERQGTTQATS